MPYQTREPGAQRIPPWNEAVAANVSSAERSVRASKGNVLSENDDGLWLAGIGQADLSPSGHPLLQSAAENDCDAAGIRIDANSRFVAPPASSTLNLSGGDWPQPYGTLSRRRIDCNTFGFSHGHPVPI